MRRLHTVTVLLLAALALSLPGMAVAREANPACHLAYRFIALLLPDPNADGSEVAEPDRVGAGEHIVVTGVTQMFPEPPTLDDILGGHWGHGPPPSDLAAAFLADPGADILQACPDLRTRLAPKGYSFGEAETTRLRAEAGSETKVLIVALSRPVLQPDGREALMYAHYLCGVRTCGEGFLLWFRKTPDGEWAVASDKSLWVS